MGQSDITRRLALTAGAALATQGRALAQDQAAPPPSPPAALDPKVRTLGFTVENGVCAVTVSFDGKGPYRFVLDSGAALFTINDRIASQAGMRSQHVGAVGGGAGGEIVNVYKVSQLQIANTLLVRDVEVSGTSFQDPRFQGLLPFVLLPQCRVDFVRRTVTVHLQHAPNPTDMELSILKQPVATPAPGRGRSPAPSRDQRPIFPATLDGKAMRVMLDTGYNGALNLTPDYVAANNLWKAYGDGELRSESASTGAARVRRVAAKSFMMGRYDLGSVPLDLSDPANALANSNFSKTKQMFDAVVGMQILHRFDLWFDGVGGIYGVRPNALFGQVAGVNRSGMTVGYGQDRKAAVLTVTPDGPAAKAGLQVGDQIRRFTSRTGAYTMADLQLALASEAGIKMSITIVRDGAEQTVMLVLEEPK